MWKDEVLLATWNKAGKAESLKMTLEILQFYCRRSCIRFSFIAIHLPRRNLMGWTTFSNTDYRYSSWKQSSRKTVVLLKGSNFKLCDKNLHWGSWNSFDNCWKGSLESLGLCGWLNGETMQTFLRESFSKPLHVWLVSIWVSVALFSLFGIWVWLFAQATEETEGYDDDKFSYNSISADVEWVINLDLQSKTHLVI